MSGDVSPNPEPGAQPSSGPPVEGPLGLLHHCLDLVGLVEGEPGPEPRSAVQYAVLSPGGGYVLFGDQEWVRSGQALEELPPGNKVAWRTVTITYGPWQHSG